MKRLLVPAPWLSALKLALALFLMAVASNAQTTGTNVLLVRTHGDAVIAGRLRAELGALGWKVSEISKPRTRTLQQLEKLGREMEATAAMRATPSKTGIELWILDPRTSRTAFEDLVSVGISRNDELLALRAVEVLRARLLKLGVPEREPESPPPQAFPKLALPPPLEPAKPAPTPPLLWLDLSAAGNASAGGIGPLAQIELGLRLEPDPAWGLSAFAALPVIETRLENAQGEADVNLTLIGAHLDVSFVRGPVSLALGAGAAAALLHLEGRAAAPFTGRERRLVTAAPIASLMLRSQVTAAMRLRLGVMSGFALPRVVVRFDDRAVARRLRS